MPSRMPSLHGCIRISFKFDLMRSLSCYMRRAYCLICLQSSPWLPSDATMTPSITTSLQKPMERSICLGIERKICKNDNFDDFKCSPRWVTRSVANACSERRPSPRRRRAPPRTQWPPARPRPTATAKR